MKPLHFNTRRKSSILHAFARVALATAFCLLSLPSGSLATENARAAGIDSKSINELIAASGAETVGVAFYDLATGEQFFIEPDASFHAASTMKVPVMMEVFRQAGRGKFSLDDRVEIKNEFASIADGSPYQLTADSDSDRSLYNRIGQSATIRELVHLMITVSSNLATNILIEQVTPGRVMDLMKRVGAKNIRVLRGVEDGKAYERGMNNTTTARDLMIILRSIADRSIVSKKASEEMINILLDQKFKEGIPAGLPAEVKAAHKTGSITRINHDAAIVYPPNRKPYVLVILTRGIQDEKRAHKLISDITRAVHEAVSSRQ